VASQGEPVTHPRLRIFSALPRPRCRACIHLVRRLVVAGARDLMADAVADQLGSLASMGERDRELTLGHRLTGGIPA
jgi:hypothetical protein